MQLMQIWHNIKKIKNYTFKSIFLNSLLYFRNATWIYGAPGGVMSENL